MTYPTELQFLTAMRPVDDALQAARVAYGAIDHMPYCASTAAHAKLELAHDALVLLLGIFVAPDLPHAPTVAELDDLFRGNDNPCAPGGVL